MKADILSITEKIRQETEKIILGKPRQIRMIIMALLAEGHVLLDDLPGLGKTTLVKTLSIVLGCDFRRIQFVPDLLPSDIMGMKIYNQKSGEFQLVRGPLMTHIVLADEINRAIPRTQAALLEAMEEKQITIDGQTYPLPAPFMVMATQNPVETESTFQLPVAQMDRFLIRLSLGYLEHDDERKMLEELGDGIPFDTIGNVTNATEITAMQEDVKSVYVSRPVADYIVSLVQKTREHPMVKMGASPRASRSLYKAAKAWAAMSGRAFVTPVDIQTILYPVMAHRLMLSNEARLSGRTAGHIIEDVLKLIPVPPGREELFREKQASRGKLFQFIREHPGHSVLFRRGDRRRIGGLQRARAFFIADFFALPDCQGLGRFCAQEHFRLPVHAGGPALSRSGSGPDLYRIQ